MSTEIAVYDDLATLLPDWQISLRARNRRPLTVKSYLSVARAFYAFLVANGMPTRVSAITREHIDHYLADLQTRTKPANAAKHYRSLHQSVQEKGLAGSGFSDDQGHRPTQLRQHVRARCTYCRVLRERLRFVRRHPQNRPAALAPGPRLALELVGRRTCGLGPLEYLLQRLFKSKELVDRDEVVQGVFGSRGLLPNPAS